MHAACLARLARDGHVADHRQDDGEPVGIRCPMCRARWHSCSNTDAASQVQDVSGQVLAPPHPHHCAVCANVDAHPECDEMMCSTCCTARNCTLRGEHREPAVRGSLSAVRRRIDRWQRGLRAESTRVTILTALTNRNRLPWQSPPNSERQNRNADLRRRIEATTLPPDGALEAEAISEQQAIRGPQRRDEVVTISDGEADEVNIWKTE